MSWPALVRVCEKSPARCSSVGTVRIRLSGVRLFERSTLTKKNVRFFLTGPPSVNPYCLMSSLPRATLFRLFVQLFALNRSLRR